MEHVLEIEHLRTYFHTEDGIVKAVDDVSLVIPKGKTVCIVGESGCGKSITAMSIMGLIDPNVGRVESGKILFEQTDLLGLSKNELKTIRGNEIAMIFQEPMSSLNPVLTIGQQLMEPLMEHKKLKRKEAERRAIQLIEQVEISRPEQIFKSYPHELSGGMLQRVMIAMAISCQPKLLIADEPTTALDVTIQAQILDILKELREQSEMSILLITHDLGVVAEMADDVVVMYAGKVVEQGEVEALFEHPVHPYTQGLLRSKPVIHQRLEELYSIPGQVPDPLQLTESCYFHDRCEHCMEICTIREPKLRQINQDQRAACWLYEEEVERV